MTKSFKEIYDEDKHVSKKDDVNLVDENISIQDDSTTTMQIIDPNTELTTSEQPSPAMIILDSSSSETNTPILPVKEPLTEEMKNILIEYQEQSATILESTMKINIKIEKSITKMVKNNTEINKKLVNDIIILIEKVENLETKLSELQNLEIPVPIINLPTKIIKKIHRDDDGLITYISETQTVDEGKDE